MRIVVDIDQTIIWSEYKDGQYKYQGSNEKLINRLNELYDKGNDIIIQTARHWDKMTMTILHLKRCGIKYHTLSMGNIPADLYINDKAIRPEEFML